MSEWTYDTAVLFIIHLLHLQTVRLNKHKHTSMNLSINNPSVPVSSQSMTSASALIPSTQTWRPGIYGWWVWCQEWLCADTCSDHAASEKDNDISLIKWLVTLHSSRSQLICSLTGLMVFSSWMPNFSMFRWASANFTKASLAAACGSRTPMTENTSPNAERGKN